MAVCATPRCPVVVDRGHCPDHARQRDRRRGSAASRGYDAKWTRVVTAFYCALVEAGIPPVCGATLPDVPSTGDSLCAAEGLQTFQPLDCDHIEAHEGQGDPRFQRQLDALRWLPIATAPKDGATVLLWWRSRGIAWWACARWMEFGDGSRGWIGESFHASESKSWTRLLGEQPTYWMPLPASPSSTPEQP